MSRPQGVLGEFSPALARLPRLSPPLWAAAVAVAATAAALPGLWSLPGIVTLAGVLLIVVVPDVAVYLLALSVPLGSLLEIGGDKFSVTPTEGLAGLLAIGWAARAMARRRLVVPLTPLSIPLAAMLAAVVVSAYQATEPSLTLKEALKWLELALVYLFIVAEMATLRKAIALLSLLFTGAIVEALTGSVQFVFELGPDPFALGRFMRAYGTFDQPNPYAGYLGMLIPLTVGLLLTRPGPRLKWFTLSAGLLATVAVGMSLSRGAWLGIALGLAVIMLCWDRRSRLVLILGALAATPFLALAFLNVLPAELATRLATVLDYFRFVDVRQEVVTGDNWAVIERVAHWQAALDMIARHPLVGVGAGNYPAVYDLYMMPGWTEALGHAHNYYLNVAAEMGIPALLIYLALLGTALWQTARWLARSGRTATAPPPLPAQRPALRNVGGAGDELLPSGGASAPGGGGQAPALRTEEAHRLLWRGILAGVLGSLVASSVHNMFDSLFVHSMSVQLGMILALAQLSVGALSSNDRSHPTS